MEATLGLRKRNEENLPQKKRRLNFENVSRHEDVEHFFRQQEAFDYADETGGVVFARDRMNQHCYPH